MQKTFKRRVRARMAKTGESYTAARRRLIAAGDHPDPGTPTYQTVVSDDRMLEATGKRHEEWFELLDRWDGTTHDHTEIARYVTGELGVDGWWGQTITVSYERARGMRAVGQMKDGWTINASKTVNIPVGELFDAVHDDALRQGWLPGAELRERTAARPKSIRYDWEDGSTRVNVSFDAKGEKKATVFVSHERLPDADTADEMKAYWRAALAELKALRE